MLWNKIECKHCNIDDTNVRNLMPLGIAQWVLPPDLQRSQRQVANKPDLKSEATARIESSTV